MKRLAGALVLAAAVAGWGSGRCQAQYMKNVFNNSGPRFSCGDTLPETSDALIGPHGMPVSIRAPQKLQPLTAESLAQAQVAGSLPPDVLRELNIDPLQAKMLIQRTQFACPPGGCPPGGMPQMALPPGGLLTPPGFGPPPGAAPVNPGPSGAMPPGGLPPDIPPPAASPGPPPILPLPGMPSLPSMPGLPGMPGMPGGYHPPGAVAAVGALSSSVSPFPVQRTEVRFVGPAGMRISWYAPRNDGRPGFSSQYLEAPARYNFAQAAIYRLKLSDIPNRPGVDLYPTLEVVPAKAKTCTFLAHSAVPVTFTEDDFEQVAAGNFLIKVIYLPNPEFQDVAATNIDELVSSRLDPGVDPIAEAQRRGSILLVIRLGNIDLEAPNTPSMETPSAYQYCPPMAAGNPGMLPPGMAGPGMPPGPGMPGPGMGGPGVPNRMVPYGGQVPPFAGNPGGPPAPQAPPAARTPQRTPGVPTSNPMPPAPQQPRVPPLPVGWLPQNSPDRGGATQQVSNPPRPTMAELASQGSWTGPTK